MAFQQVAMDPEVFGGVPIVRGTRVPVASVVALVCEGRSAEEIVLKYPELSVSDVDFCLEFQRGGAR